MDPGSILITIPRRMGVYFLKDSSDRIIYIGKAVDLRSRVRSADMLAHCESDEFALVMPQFGKAPAGS